MSVAWRLHSAGALGALAWLAGPAWMWGHSLRYRGVARPLSAAEAAWFEGRFRGSLLGRVHVAEVGRIEEVRPLLWLARAGETRGAFPLRPAGLTLGDLIVVARNETRREERYRSLLFHELVHVAQYRALGRGGFLREYIRGWAAAGFEYRAIPLEREAYAMQARFDRREAFDAESEVSRRINGQEQAPGGAASATTK